MSHGAPSIAHLLEAKGDSLSRRGSRKVPTGDRLSPGQRIRVAGQRCAGFSLIEVLCALLILGIALVGLTEGITTALRSTKDSELQATAALIAAGRIEMLQAEGDVTDGDEEGDGSGGLGLYHWKESITPASIEGLHEVTVRVQNNRTGTTLYTLRTLLFSPPYTPESGQQQSGTPGRRRKASR